MASGQSGQWLSGFCCLQTLFSIFSVFNQTGVQMPYNILITKVTIHIFVADHCVIFAVLLILTITAECCDIQKK
jgi:hypothetical protein